MKRVMALDYGDKKVGIALSDPLMITAQGLCVFEYTQKEALYKKLENLTAQYHIAHIVVGMPKNMNGTVGARGEKTQMFVDALKDRFKEITFSVWDERLSTVFAKKTMLETSVKQKNKRRVEDQLAAVFILQAYLDRYSCSSTSRYL